MAEKGRLQGYLRQFNGRGVGQGLCSLRPFRRLPGDDASFQIVRGNHYLVKSRLRLCRPAGRLFDRLFNHAPKTQSRCRGIDKGQVRTSLWQPDVHAGCDEGLPLAYNRDMQGGQGKAFWTRAPRFRLPFP